MPEFDPSVSTSPSHILAATPASSDILTVFVWFSLAALAALGGFFIAGAVRRWTQHDQAVDTFTIQDLRDMRASGQINDREFAAMRATLLAQLDLGGERASGNDVTDDSPDAETTHEDRDADPSAGSD